MDGKKERDSNIGVVRAMKGESRRRTRVEEGGGEKKRNRETGDMNTRE